MVLQGAIATSMIVPGGVFVVEFAGCMWLYFCGAVQWPYIYTHDICQFVDG